MIGTKAERTFFVFAREEDGPPPTFSATSHQDENTILRFADETIARFSELVGAIGGTSYRESDRERPKLTKAREVSVDVEGDGEVGAHPFSFAREFLTYETVTLLVEVCNSQVQSFIRLSQITAGNNRMAFFLDGDSIPGAKLTPQIEKMNQIRPNSMPIKCQSSLSN